jgi:two-component system OmpR family response regulator
MQHNIFIVDDDRFFGQMLFDHLSKNKMYQIHLITNGKECIERLHENPDVVILDYHLDADNSSNDNGMVILEKIKKMNSRIHVIMLSGQKHYGVAATTIAKGAEQYIIKDEEAFKNIDNCLKDMIKVA